MNTVDRDKFLCEEVGEEYIDRNFMTVDAMIEDFRENLTKQDWNSWTGFGVLFEWAKDQDWWTDFLEACNGIVMYEKDTRGGKDPAPFCYINMAVIDSPGDFATAISDFLKAKDEEKEKEDVPKVMVICPKASETCEGKCDHNEPHAEAAECDVGYGGEKSNFVSGCPFRRTNKNLKCEPVTEEEEDKTVDKTTVMVCMYSHLVACNKECPHADPHYSCDDCVGGHCKSVMMDASCIKSYKKVEEKEEVWST